MKLNFEQLNEIYGKTRPSGEKPINLLKTALRRLERKMDDLAGAYDLPTISYDKPPRMNHQLLLIAMLADNYAPSSNYGKMNEEARCLLYFFVNVASQPWEVSEFVLIRAHSAASFLLVKLMSFQVGVKHLTVKRRRIRKSNDKKRKTATAWRETASEIYDANPKWFGNKNASEIARRILKKWPQVDGKDKKESSEFIPDYKTLARHMKPSLKD